MQSVVKRARVFLLWLCGILAPHPWGGVGGGVCLVAGGLCSCSSRTDLERAQEGAMMAAEVYYRQLAEGRCEQFLDGKVGADSLPASYREQLLACYKQFVAQQERAHDGIAGVTAVRAEMDSAANVMQVFLQLCFGDSTREEIVVPMRRRGSAWLMK